MPLGTPDVLVCSVGTEIFFEASGAAPEPDRKWVAELDKGWDRAAAIKCAESLGQLRMQVITAYPGTSSYREYMRLLNTTPKQRHGLDKGWQ